MLSKTPDVNPGENSSNLMHQNGTSTALSTNLVVPRIITLKDEPIDALTRSDQSSMMESNEQ